MKITKLEAIVTSPGRNFTIVKIETDQGVVGYGDGTLNGRELPVASYVNDHLAPWLVGMDPRRIEDIWQLVHRGGYWRGGPVTMSALGAIDLALWDIKGKMAGMPVYDLLGGRSRDRLRLYGHASGGTIEEAVEAVGRWKEMGYEVIRAQTAVPGSKTVYGVNPMGGVTLGWVPTRASLPAEHVWDGPGYMRVVPRLFEKIREAYGDSIELVHDTHHRLRPIEAARLARDLEPFNLFWLEDVCRPESAESFRIVREASTTPLALGEVFHTIQECEPYIVNRLIDFIRVATIHAGGITHVRRILDLGALYEVRAGLHGPPDVSPIGMAAHVHLGIWAPNFGVQEWASFPSDALGEVFRHGHVIERGHVIPSDAPGLGVDFDEVAARKYPFDRSYMGVLRMPDGTAWNY